MKKVQILTALVLALTGTLLPSCKNGKQTGSMDEADTLTVAADSLVLSQAMANGKDSTTFRLVVDKPTGGQHKAVADSFVIALLTDGETTSGDSLAACMQAAANVFLEAARSFATSQPFFYNGELRLLHQTPRYATFAFSDYVYMGGAHGQSNHRCVTIAWANGEALAWDDIFTPDGQQQLLPLLKQALQEQYYKDKTPGYVDGGDILTFKLPEQAPAFVSAGLVFNYQAYEIDAYAAGCPTCILPYEKVKPLMQPAAQALLK